MKYLSLLFIVLVLATGCTPKPMALVRKASVQTKAFNETIPYKETTRLLIVKAKLNNQRTYRFIWDTGAGITLLSSKVMKELGLKPVTSMRIGDSKKQSQRLNMINIKNFELGGVQFKNIASLVINYNKTSALPCLADGIIGTNLIARCNWTIDYEAHTISLTNQAYNLHQKANSIPFKINSNGKIYFKIKTPGFTLNNVMMDSGSNGVLDLSTKNGFKTGILKKYPSTKLLDGTTQGIYGTRLDTVYTLELDSARFYGKTYFKIPVDVSRYTNQKVGNQILSRFKIKIDYAHKRMQWIPRDLPYESASSLGLVLNREANGKVTIGSIYTPSAASTQGLKINDEVIEINNQPLSKYFTDTCSFYDWVFTGRDIKQLTLTFKNGRKVTLKREPLGKKLWWK